MPQKYKNIPVKPETYAKVKLVANANDRGLGDQVAHWAGRELPAECEHAKQAVSIQVFDDAQDTLQPAVSFKQGWFCPTCKRVYARISEEELALEDGAKLLRAVREQVEGRQHKAVKA